MAVWPRLRQFGINSLNFVARRAGSGGNCKGAPPKSRTQQDISAWVKNEESKVCYYILIGLIVLFAILSGLKISKYDNLLLCR